MKAFLKAYAVCLILMEVFIFFGGWMLFDLRGTGIYRAGAVIALILAIAVCAWSSTAQKVEALEAELQELKKEARLKAEAQEIAGKLQNCPVKLSAKAGNGGKLFGAVTNKEISEGLKAQYGVDIPKQKIVLDEPIKAYGSYQVKAKLGFEVSGTVYVTVCEEK